MANTVHIFPIIKKQLIKFNLIITYIYFFNISGYGLIGYMSLLINNLLKYAHQVF